jgi:hypothetical protein
MHLRFDAAPAVVSAPSSPQGAAEVFGCAQGLVAGCGTGGDGLPRLGVLAWRDDSVRTTIRDGIMALAGVIRAICRDAGDLFICGDLTKQIGQDRCVANVVPGDLDGSDLQRFLVDPEVDLAPDPPFGAAMLAGEPFAFVRRASRRRSSIERRSRISSAASSPSSPTSASARFAPFSASRTRIASTNPLERVNREIKRRADVIGIFPNDDAIVRLVDALMPETNDEWTVARRYMSLETLARVTDNPAVRLPAVAT